MGLVIFYLHFGDFCIIFVVNVAKYTSFSEHLGTPVNLRTWVAQNKWPKIHG